MAILNQSFYFLAIFKAKQNFIIILIASRKDPFIED
jgi:hypothetical protein